MIFQNIFSISFTLIGLIALIYSFKNRTSIHLICKTDFIINDQKNLIKIQNLTSYLISIFIIMLGLLDILFKVRFYYLSAIIVLIYIIGIMSAKKCIAKKS